MVIVYRFFAAAYLIFALMLGQAYALGVNNGSAVTMGSIRGASLGAASNITYSTGAHGLTAVYGQNVMSIGGKPYVIPAAANTSKSGVISGLRKLIKSPAGKANIGMIIGVWALDKILEEAGLYPEDDGIYYIPDDGWQQIKPAPFVKITAWGNTSQEYNSIHAACASFGVEYQGSFVASRNKQSSSGCCKSSCSPKGAGFLYQQSTGCSFPYKIVYGICIDPHADLPKQPVTDAHIDALNFGRWEPPVNVPKEHVQRLYPHILPADTEIKTQPQIIDYPAEIVTAPDGTTTETSKREIVTISNPNSDPALKIEDQTTVKTYQDGQLTDTKTTTRTTDSTAATPNQGGQPQEQLIDCDLTPTLCAVQKEQLERDKARDEWLRETPPDEPDLSDLAIKEQDINRDYRIDFGSKTCPAAERISFASLDISATWDWSLACDFAGKLRLILLAIGYLIAARILVGALR